RGHHLPRLVTEKVLDHAGNFPRFMRVDCSLTHSPPPEIWAKYPVTAAGSQATLFDYLMRFLSANVQPKRHRQRLHVEPVPWRELFIPGTNRRLRRVIGLPPLG